MSLSRAKAALKAASIPLPLLQPQAPGQLSLLVRPPCSVPSCPIGKRAQWDALGDDSPAQDYAMHVHETTHEHADAS